jgi:hypothetical protein
VRAVRRGEKGCEMIHPVLLAGVLSAATPACHGARECLRLADQAHAEMMQAQWMAFLLHRQTDGLYQTFPLPIVDGATGAEYVSIQTASPGAVCLHWPSGATQCLTDPGRAAEKGQQ